MRCHGSAREAKRRACSSVALVLGVRARRAAVLGEDLLVVRLIRLLVHTDLGEEREEVRVHVRVGEVARAREDLLDVGLVRNVRGGLLEHDEMERELVLEREHHGELRHERTHNQVTRSAMEVAWCARG